MQKGSTHTYSAFPGEDTTSYRGTPFQAAMHNCNYSVISANETSFVKDIGRAEESLLAVKIYHQLRSEGLDTCWLDIHSQADHGLILDKYASSDHAFYATKELVGEIRSHMTLMLKACENLVDAANDTCDLALMASARAAVLVFVQCSLGYFLFNPFSRRYWQMTNRRLKLLLMCIVHLQEKYCFNFKSFILLMYQRVEFEVTSYLFEL